jgi:uncharacterized membrane protein
MEPQGIQDLEKKPDEIQLAGIAHISFLVGAFIFSGIMLAVCKDKCEYVRFQIAQCLATQVALFCGLMVYVLLFCCVIFFSIFAAAATKAPPLFLVVLLPIHLLVVFGSLGLNLTLAVAGMIKAFKGEDWAIPIAGKWVFEKFFHGKRPAPNGREDAAPSG